MLESLTLDVRTGETGEYVYSEDLPQSPISEEREKRALTFDIFEKLIYL